MGHYFPNYEAYYNGYGLTKCKDGSYTAVNITPELYDKCDYPNIGLGWSVDLGKTYDYEAICKRIDEVIDEREKRIGWVREFVKTTEKPDWTERYLLSSCDPSNEYGHRSRSYHTEAERYEIWESGGEYYRHWGMGYVNVSKTMYLYRQFLIEKGYIEDNV